MIKYIKNNTQSDKTWVGQVVTAGQYHEIPKDKEIAFATSNDVLIDIANSEAVMASDTSGNNDILNINSAIDFLKNNTASLVTSISFPFADKKLPNGKKVFTRVHGLSAEVHGATDNIDFIVPYPICKITGMEIIGCSVGDKVNMKVLDTPEGTVSGTPDSLLNQFGHSVWLPQGHYRYESKYDADLIEDMTIRLEYDAKDELLPKTVYINFILHQVID